MDAVRVLEVFDSLEISGGVQAVVMNVFRRMDPSKVRMDFAVYQNPESNSYYSEIIKRGGKVTIVSNPSSCGFAKFYKQFVALFKMEHYDAVHAHNIHHNGLILLAAKQAGIPIRISHCHQSYDERNASVMRRVMVAALKVLNNAVATRRVACSDLAGRYLYGRKTFEFLPNAIDVSRFDIPEGKAQLRERYGFPGDIKILIHIGRFCAPKNQLFLLDIMSALRNEKALLLMVGEGELKEEFEAEVKKRGLESSVRCLGLREDIPQLLKLSDCMLLPSIHEGLPVVAVEAQASGCYSLISEHVTRQADLQLGLVDYLSIESPSVWADRIHNLIMPVEKYSISSLHKCMMDQRFDTETNLQAWMELYQAGV